MPHQLTLVMLFLFSLAVQAQECPPNIDFENGTFSGWTSYTGTVAGVNGQNIITLFPSGGPVAGRQTMFSGGNSGPDPYGNFPINCPNGSGHSIKLGNDLGGGQAEGISYTFTIPANRPYYSLVYHYAVVFQDPSHLDFQQPRMEIEITDETDNTVIDCSSFTFYPIGSPLPGFFVSPITVDNTPVWCKDWSAVSINLNGKAGKTIKLMFKTADCTFRKHFGYAYIDVNTECSSEFVGATYCPDDTAITVQGPFGYQGYTWYNSNAQVLGNQQSITFKPPPPSGTTIAVEVTPYNGYGCPQTFTAQLLDTLTIKANAGKDTMSCNQSPVPIGSPPKQGVVYSWSPVAGLSDPTASNPLASPSVTTTYTLTARHDGGGCVDQDQVIVRASMIEDTLQLTGKDAFCVGMGDSAVLKITTNASIQWYRDGSLIPGAVQQEYHVLQSGTYYALLRNQEGCSVPSAQKKILIEKPVPGIRYPVEYAVVDYPITLTARPAGITAFWQPATNLNNSTSFKPLFNGNEDRTYTIKLTTAAGCIAVDTQQVVIVPHVDLLVPSAFTPDKDGRNDILRPILIGIKNFHYFRVYNRWGQLIYQTEKAGEGWNGKQGNTLLTTQVVVWVAEGLGVDGKLYQRKGTSAVVR